MCDNSAWLCAEVTRAASTACVRFMPETQIAAVFVLYALYYTQPSKPHSHIYVSPAHRDSLKQTTEVCSTTSSLHRMLAL